MRCIDADALKEAIRKRLGISSLKYLTEQEGVIVDEIDNAPTVEQEVFISAGDYDLFLEGYKQGKKDFARQTGEWVNDGVGQFKCSLCGRAICTSISNDKPYEDFPFCHCGADMRGTE